MKDDMMTADESSKPTTTTAAATDGATTKTTITVGNENDGGYDNVDPNAPLSKASKEVLAKRRIVKVKRPTPSTTGGGSSYSSNPFASTNLKTATYVLPDKLIVNGKCYYSETSSHNVPQLDAQLSANTNALPDKLIVNGICYYSETSSHNVLLRQIDEIRKLEAESSVIRARTAERDSQREGMLRCLQRPQYRTQETAFGGLVEVSSSARRSPGNSPSPSVHQLPAVHGSGGALAPAGGHVEAGLSLLEGFQGYVDEDHYERVQEIIPMVAEGIRERKQIFEIEAGIERKIAETSLSLTRTSLSLTRNSLRRARSIEKEAELEEFLLRVEASPRPDGRNRPPETIDSPPPQSPVARASSP